MSLLLVVSSLQRTVAPQEWSRWDVPIAALVAARIFSWGSCVWTGRRVSPGAAAPQVSPPSYPSVRVRAVRATLTLWSRCQVPWSRTTSVSPSLSVSARTAAVRAGPRTAPCRTTATTAPAQTADSTAARTPAPDRTVHGVSGPPGPSAPPPAPVATRGASGNY